MSEEKKIDLVLVGDAESGKTAIASVFSANANQFPSAYEATVGAHFFSTPIAVEGTSFKLQIWDVAGGERFLSLAPQYYQQAAAIGIVLDGTKPVSQQIGRWVGDNRRWVGDNKSRRDVPIHFVVSKIDSDQYDADAWRVAIEEWQDTHPNIKNLDADGNATQDIPVFYCSAKNNKGISEAFQGMAAGGLSHLRRTKPDLFQPQGGVMETLKDHRRWWVGVNGVLIAAVIVLLILTAVVPPVGAALALGGLSGLAIAGIVGGGAVVVWNVVCAIREGILKRPPSDGGENKANFQQNQDDRKLVENSSELNHKNDEDNDLSQGDEDNYLSQNDEDTKLPQNKAATKFQKGNDESGSDESGSDDESDDAMNSQGNSWYSSPVGQPRQASVSSSTLSGRRDEKSQSPPVVSSGPGKGHTGT